MYFSAFANTSCAKLAVLLFAAGILSPARSELMTGLTTDNRIVRFDSAAPASVFSSTSITGLAAGQDLIGIDLRPIDLALVGVGFDVATGMGQVYNLDRNSGAATPISGLFSLTGTGFGVDFNPVPNALRIVTNGTGVDNNFRITMGGTGTVNTDGRLNVAGFQDPSLGIVGAAYANNVPGGIGGQTTLYLVDAPSGQLYTQGTVNFPPGISPNTGSLFLVGSLGLGAGLPVNVGFDISGNSGAAFLSTGGSLYQVDLTSGATASLGAFAGNIADVTVDPVPEPATVGLHGCRRDSDCPRSQESKRARLSGIAAPARSFTFPKEESCPLSTQGYAAGRKSTGLAAYPGLGGYGSRTTAERLADCHGWEYYQLHEFMIGGRTGAAHLTRSHSHSGAVKRQLQVSLSSKNSKAARCDCDPSLA